VGVSNKFKMGITLIVALSAVAILSGCTPGKGLTPLPDKERYQFIDEVKDDLDYKSSGKVISEQYDNNDGVFNPSSFVVELQGADSFEILSKRAKNLSHNKCYSSPSPATGEQTWCKVGQVSIKVFRENVKTDKVLLSIADSLSGRNSK
jgi:hypothetical protein